VVALFGVGIESFLGRDAPVEVYRGMLNLKLIWSVASVLGIALWLLQSARPPADSLRDSC
jgi:hypothetical protein